MGCLLTSIFVAATVTSGILCGWRGALIAGVVVLVSYVNLGVVFANTQFGSHFLGEAIVISLVTGGVAWALWIINSTTALSLDLRWLCWLFVSWSVGIVYAAWEDSKEHKH